MCELETAQTPERAGLPLLFAPAYIAANPTILQNWWAWVVALVFHSLSGHLPWRRNLAGAEGVNPRVYPKSIALAWKSF